MKSFFIALQILLKAITGVAYVNKWKQQHNAIVEGKMELFPYPAVFIELVSSEPITNQMSMGGGTQLYEVNFRLHILYWMLDAGDGDFEKNIEIYDLQDKVYKAVNKFYPGATDIINPVGNCIRSGWYEDNEWSHAGVTHLIQDWKTTIVDNITEEPIDGIDSSPTPLPLDTEITTNNWDDAPAYNSAIQYFATNETVVKQAGSVYRCTLNTPNPAGTFSLLYWTLIEPNTYNFTPTP